MPHSISIFITKHYIACCKIQHWPHWPILLTSCKVTGKRKHSKGLLGGMAIPCKLCWTSSNEKHVKKLAALIAAEGTKILRRYGLSSCLRCRHVRNNLKWTLKCQFSVKLWRVVHINEVSKRLYPCISRTPNFGPIFPEKKVRPICW